MSGSGLSITQFSIVRALNRNGETPLSELAKELVMERTSLYRTIAPLEAVGAVKISAAEKGRSKLAVLTDTGRQMMLAATPHWERAQSDIVKALGEPVWRALSQSLNSIPNIVEDLS